MPVLDTATDVVNRVKFNSSNNNNKSYRMYLVIVAKNVDPIFLGVGIITS